MLSGLSAGSWGFVSFRYLLLTLSLIAVWAGEVQAQRGVVVGRAQPYLQEPDLGAARRAGDAWIWSHTVLAPGASFVKLRISGLDLRRGDTLSVSTLGGRRIEIYTGRGPKELGTFWTLSVPGDAAHLKFVFARPYTKPPFSVDRLIAGDPAFSVGRGAGPTSRSLCGAPDFEDVACYEPDTDKWANIRATAGVMVVGGDAMTALFCTAVNVSAENHLLTNHHCIGSQSLCDNTEYVFGFHRPGCGDGSAPSEDWAGFRCDQLLASEPFDTCETAPGTLDFSVTSVLGDPAAQFGYVQPDATPLVDGESVYIVQHADGRPKEIAHGDQVVAEPWVLRYWGSLDTEPGSSGAPVYRASDDALVGLHHCGGCDDPGARNRGMPMSALVPLIEPYLCNPALELVAVDPEPAADVDAGGDTYLDPGEQWALVPQVLNKSCSEVATTVSATFEINAATTADVTLLDTTTTFGDIGAGVTRAAAAPVRFAVSPLTACGSRVVIDMTDILSVEGSYPATVSQLDLQVGREAADNLVAENFVSGIPAEWLVAHFGSGSGPAATWTDTNPANRSLPLAEPFAIADSAALGSGVTMDEELITPAVDASGYASLSLHFVHDFNWFIGGGDEQADVDVRSSATGGGWINLANFSGADASGAVEMDLTMWAAADLQVRFRYYNARFDNWWAVDDIRLAASNGFECTPDSDLDADGIPDSADNCLSVANPSQLDTDGDAIGNLCDQDIAPISNDCQINFSDLVALRDALFAGVGEPQWNADADFDGNLIVNFTDVQYLRDALFGAPGPSGLANDCEAR